MDDCDKQVTRIQRLCPSGVSTEDVVKSAISWQGPVCFAAKWAQALLAETSDLCMAHPDDNILHSQVY
jgi:hypothetical protein